MTPFEQYLISIGYKRYRKVYNRHKWEYIEDNKGYSFSTMGNLDYRYVLNGDFDKEIIFGLEESGKPPTLCWPNPFKRTGGVIEQDNYITTGDLISRFIRTHTPEEVYRFIRQ